MEATTLSNATSNIDDNPINSSSIATQQNDNKRESESEIESNPKRLRLDSETKDPVSNGEEFSDKHDPNAIPNIDNETAVTHTEDEEELELPSGKDKYAASDVEEVLKYKTEDKECKLLIKLKEAKEGWISHRYLEKMLLVEWQTRLLLEEQRKVAPNRAPVSVIQSTNPNSEPKFDEILRREIELNKKCFIFDQSGHPRFVEKILGITNNMGNLEFVVKFKYLRQERLLEARILNEQVPHIVISYYEERVTWGTEKTNHYIVDNKQII